MSETRAKRRAILVLGMHRSGTSATTRVVNLLGARLGDQLMPPAGNNNETGFWEHEGVVRIDDALLTELGGSWHDLRPLPDGWIRSEPARVARGALIELLDGQFHGDALWAVKDPRMCLLLPLWLDVLRELDVEPCILLVVRHPAEVAQSLQKRDGLPLPQSLWLWLRYTVEAERATRGLRRAVVGYPSLLEDWRGAMTRAAASMLIDWPNPLDRMEAIVDSFLSASQRHHEFDTTDNADLPLAVRRLHAALVAAEHGESGWATAKRISDEYAEAESLFGFGLEAAYAAGEKASPGDGAVVRELMSSLAASVLDEVPSEPAALPKVQDAAKLYWQCGDDTFNESCSAMIEHAGMAVPTRFLFRLPDDVRFDSVRFDPSMLSGQFEVFSLRVNGQPIDDIASRVLQVHQHRLPSNGPQHVRVLGLDGDPWVRFDLHDCQVEGGGPMEIEISCRHESARDWVRNIIDVAVLSGMASTVQTMTNAVAMNLDAIRSNHDRQIQAVADQQERMDAHVARIEQKLTDLSDRSERHEASMMQALTDAMAANLKAVEQQHKVMTRMIDECQSRMDAQTAATDQNFARNLQQLVQVETTIKTLLDRMLEGVAAMLDNQNRSFWQRLRRK